jgi:uncharacterized membrane protein
MFDTILGLPVHALVVHVVVVLVPLAAVGLIAVAVRPAWRRPYLPLVVACATIGLAAVPVATRSGQHLKARLNAGGEVAKQIHNHEQMGKLVIYPTIALWLLSIALLWLDRRDGSKRATTVVAVLGVVAALAAAAQVTITGHLGSTAVWKCTIGACQ